jgi:hypothetical protein
MTNLPPVFEIVKSEGFELHKRGNGWRGLCPIHDSDGRNPSFACGDTWWKCYSCGESGDGPAFIMKLKNMTFPQALSYLGVERRRPSRQQRAQLAKERRQRIKAEWAESDLAWAIGTTIRRCHVALKCITPGNFDNHALVLQQLSTLEYQHQFFIDGTPTDKAAVLADWKGTKLLKRNLLFKENFDFRAWVRRVNMTQSAPVEVVEEPQHHECNRIEISFA